MQPAIINIFEKAARKAGKILTRDFGEIENLQIKSKSVGDFVTNSDLKVEEVLIETLKYYYPNAIFLTEEPSERRLIGEANRKHFPNGPPAMSWIRVVGLFRPEVKVEVEAIAAVD